jgi:hypothetical protein
MVWGTAVNGQYVRINWDKPPVVLLSPRVTRTSVIGYSDVSLQAVCEAYDITPAGFRVRNETRILESQGLTYLGNLSVVEPNAVQIITTPPNISSAILHITAYLGAIIIFMPIVGRITLEFSYRPVGTTLWSLSGRVALTSFMQEVTATHSITGLPIGQYEIKVTRIGFQAKSPVDSDDAFSPALPNSGGALSGNYCRLTTAQYNGGGVLANLGTVDFIALETDGVSYYTIED